MEQLINDLKDEIRQLRVLIAQQSSCAAIRAKWIPRHELMKFLDYGDTQMTSIAKTYKLVSAKVGKRIFYHADSILEILDGGKQ